MSESELPLLTSPATPDPSGREPTISSVAVRRFKRIEDFSLNLDAFPTILVGANNSGKSSILHAIHFAVSVAQTARLVGERVNWASNKFELSFNPTQLLWSPVADAMSLARGGVLVEQLNQQIEITLRDSVGNQVVVSVRRGRNRNISVALGGRVLGERLQSLNRPFSVYTPGLAGIARQELYLSPGVVRRAVARGDANLVLRNVLLMLQRDPPKWSVFCGDIQQLFPGIEFELRFDEDTDEHIAAFVSIEDGPKLPLDAAGTAVLQATQILGYLALYSPPLILLDEPDSHLHPNNQRSLCRLFTQLAQERGFRLMIATHSRHVLDALRSQSNVVWLNQGMVVPNATATMTARLLELGALDSVDFFADGQTKCVVLTEDSETEPLRALLLSNGFVDEDTRVASYAGCSKIEAATVLGQFIEAHAQRVTVIIHRDRDYMTDDEVASYNEAVERCGLQPFVTDKNDIEAYFVNAEHLAELNAGVSVEEVDGIINEVIRETQNFSLEAITNLRVEAAYRARSRTGSPPNVGQIANQTADEYDANPRDMARGKIVIGRVSAGIQRIIGANPRVFESTHYLLSQALAALATRIWPD